MWCQKTWPAAGALCKNGDSCDVSIWQRRVGVSGQQCSYTQIHLNDSRCVCGRLLLSQPRSDGAGSPAVCLWPSLTFKHQDEEKMLMGFCSFVFLYLFHSRPVKQEMEKKWKQRYRNTRLDCSWRVKADLLGNLWYLTAKASSMERSCGCCSEIIIHACGTLGDPSHITLQICEKMKRKCSHELKINKYCRRCSGFKTFNRTGENMTAFYALLILLTK